MVGTLNLQKQSTRSKLGLFAVASFIVSILSLGASAVMALAFLLLATKEPPNLVQLESGKAIITEPMTTKDRTPAIVQRFIQEQMTMIMSASRTIQIPDSAPIQDDGVELSTDQGNRRVSSIASLASFALSEDFRPEFLQELAKLTPQNVFSGSFPEQTALIVQDVSIPVPIEGEAGHWKITMIANWVHFDATHPQGRPTPFNKEIFVRAVPPPAVQTFSDPLEKEIADTRKAGLEIYGIRNYVPSDLPE